MRPGRVGNGRRGEWAVEGRKKERKKERKFEVALGRKGGVCCAGVEEAAVERFVENDRRRLS